MTFLKQFIEDSHRIDITIKYCTSCKKTRHTEERSTDAKKQILAAQEEGKFESGCEMNICHMIKEIKELKTYF